MSLIMLINIDPRWILRARTCCPRKLAAKRKKRSSSIQKIQPERLSGNDEGRYTFLNNEKMTTKEWRMGDNPLTDI